jgi:hypothetical protein
MNRLSTVGVNNCSVLLWVPQETLLSQMRRCLQVPEDSFAFLVDADFVLVKDFAAKLKTGAPGTLLRYASDAWKHRSERHAVIIPAFQREPEDEETHDVHACAPSLKDIQADSDCWMYNQYDVPLTEAALQRMLTDGSITGFYEDRVRSVFPRLFWGG